MLCEVHMTLPGFSEPSGVVIVIYNQTKLDFKIESTIIEGKYQQEGVSPLYSGYLTSAVATDVSVVYQGE